MRMKNDRPLSDIPPLCDPNNYFALAFENTEKSEILNKYFSSISNLDYKNRNFYIE